MAYTPEEFAYFEVVFTGLPILSLTVGQEIGTQDVPARLAVSAADESAGYADCRVHRRGASTLTHEKGAYRIELTRGEGGGHRKAYRALPGLGTTGEAVLVACNYDQTLMRDRLCWAMYDELHAPGRAFDARRSAYVELLIDGQYEGVYLMLEPYDIERELEQEGAVLTDSVYRTAVLNFARGKPVFTTPRMDNSGYELFYAPAAGHEFDALAAFVDLAEEPDDAAFARKASERLDMDSLLRYELLLQACGMTDNTYNNLYIQAHPTANGMLYRFAPWDMDLTWGIKREDIGQEYENWMTFTLADRVLRLDVDGAREKLARLWTDYRQTAIRVETVQALTDGYAHELADSGAYARNAARWDLESYAPDPFELTTFAQVRFSLLDEAMARMAAAGGGERVAFLESDDIKGVPMTE